MRLLLIVGAATILWLCIAHFVMGPTPRYARPRLTRGPKR